MRERATKIMHVIDELRESAGRKTLVICELQIPTTRILLPKHELLGFSGGCKYAVNEIVSQN